jgi:tetratricopeptide (TPR) repeat protein
MELRSLFDSYLERKMSDADRVLFEKLLSENADYNAQLHAYQQERSGLVKKASSNKVVQEWVIPSAIAIVIVAAGYFLISLAIMSPGEKIFAKFYKPYPNQVPPSAYPEKLNELADQAFRAYDKGDFQKAAELLDKIQTSSHRDFILLYLGICQLELNRPEKAIPYLNRIKAGSALAPKEVASWFEALSYFKLSMEEKGKELLQVTASRPNPFQEDAMRILESVD